MQRAPRGLLLPGDRPGFGQPHTPSLAGSRRGPIGLALESSECQIDGFQFVCWESELSCGVFIAMLSLLH
jgi:hypothetical protein